jgi:pyrimidine operon attenuation protein / uracil phosphoribosyltransferase
LIEPHGKPTDTWTRTKSQQASSAWRCHKFRIRRQATGLVGIRSRGDEVAERLLTILSEDDRELAFGILDISLYRDDFEHLHENPTLQESDIPFPVDGAHIILVDDVLFTGRTIRAALDALSDYGRPGKVELAVLIDRGHREMPIQPDYVGIHLDTQRLDHVLGLARRDRWQGRGQNRPARNPMSLLPERKKSPAEIARLRESLGVPDPSAGEAENSAATPSDAATSPVDTIVPANHEATVVHTPETVPLSPQP